MITRVSNLIYSVDWETQTPVLAIIDNEITLVTRREAQKLLSRSRPTLVVDLEKNEEALRSEIAEQVESQRNKKGRSANKIAV